MPAPRPSRLAHRRSGVATVLAAAIAVALALTTVPAAAHSILVATTPSAGDRLEALTEVRFDFAGDLADEGHVVTLVTASGEVPATAYQLPEASSLVATFPPDVPDGDHEIVFDVVAGDGHRERGRIPVTVAAAPAAGPTSPTTAAGGDQPPATEAEDEAAAGEVDGDDGGLPLGVVAGAVALGAGAAALVVHRSRRPGSSPGPA